MTRENPIVLIGVAGTGMRGLAHLLAEQGLSLLGTDQNTRKVADDQTLQREVQILEPSELVTHVTAETKVIYSDAVPEDDLVRQAAFSHEAKQLSYPEAVAELAEDKHVIAVAGTHGKTTTTSLLAHVLIEQQLDPTAVVGTTIASWGEQNSRAGNSDYFIVEADEYRDHFLAYKPDHTIVVSLDFDHPDFFHDMKHVEESFSRLFDQAQGEKVVIVPTAVVAEHPGVRWPANTITVDEPLKATEVPNLKGEHLRLNAALVVALAERLGLERPDIIASLNTTPPIGRRLEKLGHVDGVSVISDYGHHPAEVAATLKGLREVFPQEKILALFEAHTLARLQTFYQEFIDSFALADALHVVPVFVPPGREDEASLAAKLQAKMVTESSSLRPTTETVTWDTFENDFREVAKKKELIIGFSAGKLDQELRDLVS